MKLSRLALPLFLLPGGELLADTSDRDQALKLPDTLISANRQVEARNDSSAANTVFTREDIDRLQPTSLTDLLQRVPGVQVAQSGGRGALPNIFIRGTNSAQSLVLVDGQRIGSSSSGDSNLQFISVEQIERVEVLRGSRSAIYGSDAIGGVIQIFTRRSADSGLHGRMRVAAGSNQTWERSLGLSGGNQQTRFSLGANLDESAGIDWTHTSYPSDTDHDGYRNQSLSFTLSHALSDDLKWASTCWITEAAAVMTTLSPRSRTLTPTSPSAAPAALSMRRSMTAGSPDWNWVTAKTATSSAINSAMNVACSTLTATHLPGKTICV